MKKSISVRSHKSLLFTPDSKWIQFKKDGIVLVVDDAAADGKTNEYWFKVLGNMEIGWLLVNERNASQMDDFLSPIG